MAEFLNADADGAGFFGIVKNCSELTFGGRGYDFLENLAWDMYGTFGAGNKGIGIAFAEEVETSPAGVGFGFREVQQAVGFDSEKHVTGAEGTMVSGCNAA